MATKSDEPEVIQAPADTTAIIVPVTGAIYHNGSEKPTERWCFEIGLRIVGDETGRLINSVIQDQLLCAAHKYCYFKIFLN